jgi:hypothetical protein
MDMDLFINAYDLANSETWANTALALVGEAIADKKNNLSITETIKAFDKTAFKMWGRILALTESDKELDKAADNFEKDPENDELFALLSARIAEELNNNADFAKKFSPLLLQLVRLEKNVRLEPLTNYSNRTQKLEFKDEE